MTIQNALAVLTVSATILLTACGPLKYELVGSAAAVGADATLIADVQKDAGVTRVTMKVKNLAPPERIASGSTAFVMWQRKDSSATWARVAALKYDEGTREASIEELSVPETAFDLQVTAEPGPQPDAPSTVVIFGQRVEK